MKVKNYDYQSIIPFEKAKPNAKFKPERCFKYYIKRTKNKVYALEETFKYIDNYYAGYKKNDKMNASEKYANQEILIDRLSDLDYDNQMSFSVAYSVVASLVMSFYFSVLQTSDRSGKNFFEGLNISIENLETFINQQSNIFVKILEILCGLLLISLTIALVSLPAVCLIELIKDKYKSTKYYNKFLKPYERKAVQEALATYGSDYYFLK